MFVFWSDRDGNPELYVGAADGSGITRLTDHPGVDRNPAWGP
jgi:TolB protein